MATRSDVTHGWRLSAEAFDRLLQALDTDRERAAVAYELLRHRIVGLMRWWGVPTAEDLADLTIDRVARKLEEGALVPQGSFGAYVRAVARLIFYEWRRSSSLTLPVAALVPAAQDQEQTLRSLDQALLTLEPAERSLVLRYYGDGNKAEIRRRLAEELGISPTALRIRTHRLRSRLEAFMANDLRV